MGYKLGLTSRNKHRAMGLDSPLYGRVTSSMLSTYGDPIRFDRFIHPRVDSRDRVPDRSRAAAPATVTSVLAATELVDGAVDVLESRYEARSAIQSAEFGRQDENAGIMVEVTAYRG